MKFFLFINFKIVLTFLFSLFYYNICDDIIYDKDFLLTKKDYKISFEKIIENNTFSVSGYLQISILNLNENFYFKPEHFRKILNNLCKMLGYDNNHFHLYDCKNIPGKCYIIFV